MKHILSVSIKFYKDNGLIGIFSRKIGQIRGGADNPGRIPHNAEYYKDPSRTLGTPRTAEEIDEILNDERITEEQKVPFRSLREDPMYGDSEKLKADKLRANMIAKSQHPLYAKIKGKIPFAILSSFTFAELARLGAYRVAGFASAPLTIPALIGFSMPCAVTFAMLEMYVPDKFKFPCKCFKWTGGAIFYGVCASVDYATAGIETKVFKQPLPMDAPQLMGTLPTKNDLEELSKLKSLADSIMKKSNSLSTLGEN